MVELHYTVSGEYLVGDSCETFEVICKALGGDFVLNTAPTIASILKPALISALANMFFM